MNRKRCPWCGKIIYKDNDKVSMQDTFFSPSVPRMLHKANCNHCGHKYGQALVFPYVLSIGLIILGLVILAFIFQSVLIILLAFSSCFLFHFMPYSKLDDEGKTCEENTELLCRIVVINKYNKIKRDEIYFLNDHFDDFNPFVLVSPIRICHIFKKNNILRGEFLYMHEKNYEYIEKDHCELYDTNMNLIATIKFITDPEINL